MIGGPRKTPSNSGFSSAALVFGPTERLAVYGLLIPARRTGSGCRRPQSNLERCFGVLVSAGRCNWSAPPPDPSRRNCAAWPRTRSKDIPISLARSSHALLRLPNSKSSNSPGSLACSSRRGLRSIWQLLVPRFLARTRPVSFGGSRSEPQTPLMPSLLILTVGTGTAGKHSDVASGLARTIDLCAPRLFWLVPSASEKSRPVADLIRESIGCPGAFRPWSTEEPYHTIADPDDIHQCRAVLREVIAEARKQLKPGERLIVNPTSGTKQMSAGATPLGA